MGLREEIEAARTALGALGIGTGDRLLIHLGDWVGQASRSHTSTCSTVNEARRPGIARVRERG